MSFLAHISTGYLLYKSAFNIAGLENNLLLATSIAGALIPDIDGLFGAQIKDHRNTGFHAPLFWLGSFVLVYFLFQVINNFSIKPYTNLFFAGVFIHLFLDWFSGRTAGIRIFYPFSKKVYALFSLTPEKGKIPVFPKKSHLKEYLEFWKFYLRNKFLVASELLVILSPIALYIKGILI